MHNLNVSKTLEAKKDKHASQMPVLEESKNDELETDRNKDETRIRDNNTITNFDAENYPKIKVSNVILGGEEESEMTRPNRYAYDSFL